MIFPVLYTAALQPRYISILYFDHKAVRKASFRLLVHFFCLFKRSLPADDMLVHFAGRIDFSLVAFQGLVPFRLSSSTWMPYEVPVSGQISPVCFVASAEGSETDRDDASAV